MPRPHLNPRSFPRIVIRFPTSVFDSCDPAEKAVGLPSSRERAWGQPPDRITMTMKQKPAAPSPFQRQPVTLLVHNFILKTSGSSLGPSYLHLHVEQKMVCEP